MMMMWSKPTGSSRTRLHKSFSQDAATQAGMDPTRFPQTPSEVQKAEETIALELDKLSLDEHEQILFDVHGIGSLGILEEDEEYDKEQHQQQQPQHQRSPFTQHQHHPYASSPPPLSSSSSSSQSSMHEYSSFVKTKLKEFDQRLEDLIHRRPDRPKEAYLKAKYWNQDYVTSSAFRLLFLRAEGFHDVVAAAEGMLQHFEVKQELFGASEILARDVQLSDLSREEWEMLQLGNMQVLPTRDAAGRTILVYRCRPYPNLDALARCHWYFVNTCLREDEDAQKKGFVIVFFVLGEQEEAVGGFRVLQRIHHVRTGIPERIVGAHFCVLNRQEEQKKGDGGSGSGGGGGTSSSSSFFWSHSRPFVAGIHLFLNSFARPRLRTHVGTSLAEIQFALQTYGIDTDECPLQLDNEIVPNGDDTNQKDDDGNSTSATVGTAALCWKVDRHLQWLARRSKREQEWEGRMNAVSTSALQGAGESAKSHTVVIVPRRFDCLFGQHEMIRKHTGNLRARHLVEMHWTTYESANKYQKTEVADRIVQMIHESQGRFLKWDPVDSEWIQVDHDLSREKISHYFRYFRSKLPKTTSPSSSSSSDATPMRTTTNTTKKKRRAAPSSLAPLPKHQV